MRLKMSLLKGDPGISNEEKLFSLSSIKCAKVLEHVNDDSMGHNDGDSSVEENQSDDCMLSSASDDGTADDEVIHHVSDRQSVSGKPRRSNPLLVQFDASNYLAAKSQWFDQDVFKNLEDDEDEDTELSKITQVNIMYGKDRAAISTEKAKKQHVESEDTQHNRKDDKKEDGSAEMQKTGETFQPLDPVGLAIGTQIAVSKKRKHELQDDSYHRWTFNDTSLPDWFTEDEKKHYRRQLPVSKEMVQQYVSRQREVNARPIKKVAEAKARKAKLKLRRLKRLSKKAEALEGDMDVSAQEKLRHIQKLYRKLKKEPKKEVTYVVARKGLGKHTCMYMYNLLFHTYEVT
jgi:AdoMet-dependent rRNA methyltransferase SPB1